MPRRKFVFHLILHSAALLEERLRERLEPYGVTPRQARVLVALEEMGPVSQATLAQEFRIKAASMSTMTSRLIANDYIRRGTNPRDKRANVLELTETGRAFLSEIEAAWADTDVLIRDALGDEATQALAGHARNLRDALGGVVPRRQAHHDDTDPTS